ncbi:hypothetical protein PEBR_00513 [Penicillium brasilianum]|uniref:Uncharacterized protein n=1 Tax=Penicillium brasilianum TaxID=104259 RepID=A0A1S9S0Q6_PENBI|nr:hypothetical protein PEBR_00513 [Penicillium brasilianum]
MFMTLASIAHGGSAEDVEIQLDSDVAKHLQSLLSSSDNNNCDVGDDFFKSNTIHTRGLPMSSVTCGVQNILADGINGDGFPDWLLMAPTPLPWTNAEVVAGVQTVITWALNSATRLNTAVVPNGLRGLTIGAFAFSYIYYINGKIATSNIIPGASLQGGVNATECLLQRAVQCGTNCGVHSWVVTVPKLHLLNHRFIGTEQDFTDNRILGNDPARNQDAYFALARSKGLPQMV